jgi:hypothetical protein
MRRPEPAWPAPILLVCADSAMSWWRCDACGSAAVDFLGCAPRELHCTASAKAAPRCHCSGQKPVRRPVGGCCGSCYSGCGAAAAAAGGGGRGGDNGSGGAGCGGDERPAEGAVAGGGGAEVVRPARGPAGSRPSLRHVLAVAVAVGRRRRRW